MKCWCTMPMPASMAADGDLKVTSVPFTAMVPASGWCIPYSVFISVDLPAPFSPTMAWMVPVRTLSQTSLFAMTPGNRFSIPVSSTASGSSVARRRHR